MQDYNTIIGAIQMRLNGCPTRSVMDRYKIGSGTLSLIMERYHAGGIPIEELQMMLPKEVESLFYPQKNIKKKDIPLPDFQYYYDRIHAPNSRVNISYCWLDYKEHNPNGYEKSQFYEYYNRFVVEKEVFMEDEIPLVINYLRENPSLFNYGILFTFQTGLRVGELSALKPSDKHGRIIKVRRIEDKYRDENVKWVITIKEYSKTDAGNRNLILPSSACDTFEEIMKLRQDGEFLFEQNGKRVRGNAFNKHLSRICEKLDIPHRTMHKIRKTYGTTLIDNHVDERFITEQMGHADISTTKKLYYFSNKTRKAKEEQIEQAVYF